jgi:hypothetical protein
MSNEKVKKKKIAPTEDPKLEQVDEDRSFEVEYDEETNEAVFVMHYRRHWGDEMDADVEHALTMEENNSLIVSLMEILEWQRATLLSQRGTVLEVKSTPDLTEGNPVKKYKKLGDTVEEVAQQVYDETRKEKKDD